MKNLKTTNKSGIKLDTKIYQKIAKHSFKTPFLKELNPPVNAVKGPLAEQTCECLRCDWRATERTLVKL